MAGPTRNPASRRSSTPDLTGSGPPLPRHALGPHCLYREELQAPPPGHHATSPALPAPQPTPHGVLRHAGALLCFSDFCLETGARGLSASDLSTAASTWHLTVLTQFLQSGAALEREGTPLLWTWMAHCGWKLPGLRADMSVALTGRDQQSRGRCRLSGRERSSGLHPSSLCFGRGGCLI